MRIVKVSGRGQFLLDGRTVDRKLRAQGWRVSSEWKSYNLPNGQVEYTALVEKIDSNS